MSPTVSRVEAGAAARALAQVSVVSAAVEPLELPGVHESVAAGTFPGATAGERLNAAVAACAGEYVLLVGEGVAIRVEAVEHLVSALADESVGAACGRLVAADGRLLEAGGIVWGDGSIESYGRGADPADGLYSFARDVDFGSARCLLVRRAVLAPVDEELDSLDHIGADLCLTLHGRGSRVRYVPPAWATVSVGRMLVVADSTGLAPSAETLERLRPVPSGGEPEPIPSRRVLVVGIYLAARLTNVDDSIRALASERHDVVQRWVGLGGPAPTDRVAAVTARTVMERTPKYALLNSLLEDEDLSAYDEVLVTDDDVVYPERFLDRYLPLKERHGFVLAQPARTLNSYVDHPIVAQQPGIEARRTRFVEIGPVVSFHRSIHDLVFPHDLANDMGWGFEQVWARQLSARGLAAGIVDATPVDHSIRKPAEHYSHGKAVEQRDAYLAANEHLELGECFRVLAAMPLPEIAR
jgi:hypothetical protein